MMAFDSFCFFRELSREIEVFGRTTSQSEGVRDPGKLPEGTNFTSFFQSLGTTRL